MLSKLLLSKYFPKTADPGILMLRIAVFVPLFMKHGIEKALHFSQMAHSFSDPIGIGMIPTFLIAFTSDVLCSLMVIFGLATRWAAVFMFCNIFVAWSIKGHFWFWAHEASHGELEVVYLGALLAMIVLGPGKYSIDAILERRGA